MNNNQMPIGVFDSGVGGISVLKELSCLMPHENFIYYGDSANAPYGTKDDAKIKKLTEDAIDKLCSLGVKAIVIACNTATSIAAHSLRKRLSIPVIGIEPAVKPAATNHPGKNIIVMATPVTLKRKKFLELTSNFSNMANIIPLPCPGLVELIESHSDDTQKIRTYLKDLFAQFENTKISVVVLGCTHYPHIAKIIKEAFDYEVEILDGGEGTAREAMRQLEAIGELNNSENKGKIEFLSSKSDEKEIEFMKKFFESYQPRGV